MKLTYLCKTALLFGVLSGLAGVTSRSAEPEAASFRFADAAGAFEKLSLTVDATKLKPAGFTPGNITGSIGILPGSHRFTVSSPKAEVAAVTLPLQANSSTTLIAYCTVAVDSQTKKVKKTLQLHPRVNPPPNAGKHFQLLYVSGRPEVDITLNGAPARMKAMKEINVPDSPKGVISIEQAGKSVVKFNAPEAGNFLVVLYDSADGNFAALVVPNYK